MFVVITVILLTKPVAASLNVSATRLSSEFVLPL